MKIFMESQAKLYIQSQIRDEVYELVWSYVLEYENAKNPYIDKREAIAPWRNIADENVSEENEAILQYAENLTSYGIKTYDALHIACAVYAKCDYYITTDTKLLKTKLKEIKIVNPIDFIMEDHYED
jgi:predicted nucleic acid-binding protein